MVLVLRITYPETVTSSPMLTTDFPGPCMDISAPAIGTINNPRITTQRADILFSMPSNRHLALKNVSAQPFPYKHHNL